MKSYDGIDGRHEGKSEKLHTIVHIVPQDYSIIIYHLYNCMFFLFIWQLNPNAEGRQIGD